MTNECCLERVKRWVLQVTNPNSSVCSFTALLGATSSSLYRVELEDNTYVLRIYTNREWNEREPDLALHEASSLDAMKGGLLKTPQLIAVDQEGKQVGYPAVLMSEVQGTPQLFPLDQKAIVQLAKSLHSLHSMEIEFDWVYSSYYEIETLQAPKWSCQVGLWEKAIEYTRRFHVKYKRQDVTFIHRDYHPMNVLWEGNQITGVVDWVNACKGPRGVDVGHCRLNLALLYGIEIADRFLYEYEKLSGDDFTYHPYWDLRMIFEFLPGPPPVYQGWIDVGATGLTEQLMEKRFEGYMRSVWSRLH